MTKRVEQAMMNIKIITGQARLTREEHKQLIEDVDVIEAELNKKQTRKEK